LGFLGPCRQRLQGLAAGLRHALGACRWARPLALALVRGTGADLARSRAPLLAEHALLRQQLLVLRRGGARPALTLDRVRLALLIVRPATRRRWHRVGCRALAATIAPDAGLPTLPAETVALSRRMATANPRWGAERSCGERGKLGSASPSAPSRRTCRGRADRARPASPGRRSCAITRTTAASARSTRSSSSRSGGAGWCTSA
jgi:hypothetical protein